MERNYPVSISEFFLSFAEALDFINPHVVKHHYNVSYIALEIAKKLNLSSQTIETILQAALVHDIGIISHQERAKSVAFEFESEDRHALFGALLLRHHWKLHELSDIVRHHHTHWQSADDAPAIHPGSHLIYLADRIAILVDYTQPILPQRKQIIAIIRSERGEKFQPDMVDAFVELSANESFWLNLVTEAKSYLIRENLDFDKKLLTLDEILHFGKAFISAVDLRSRYTAAHSHTVAAVAEELGRRLGMGEHEAKRTRLAGYFHDLGKVAVPSEIINKPGRLNNAEMEVMKSHPYFTYIILRNISGLGNIAETAYCHHESPSGDGYPFHRKDPNLLFEAKLLRAADVFTALTEQRPYREALSQPKISGILNEMVNTNQILPQFRDLILTHFPDFKSISHDQQERAYQEYTAVEAIFSQAPPVSA